MHTRLRVFALVVMTALVGAVLTAVPAGAGPAACDSRTKDNLKKLLECVTL